MHRYKWMGEGCHGFPQQSSQNADMDGGQYMSTWESTDRWRSITSADTGQPCKQSRGITSDSSTKPLPDPSSPRSEISWGCRAREIGDLKERFCLITSFRFQFYKDARSAPIIQSGFNNSNSHIAFASKKILYIYINIYIYKVRSVCCVRD